jgi:glycosyltransferase involved in cell wall biosynthesis
VHYISFSKNFGHQAALRAGLDYADGDAVISMDVDMQHPPKLLPKLINKWLEGYDIVYTVRDDSKADTSGIKKLTSKGFYKFMNWISGLSIEEGAADFRLIDKRVVNVIRQLSESQLFIRGFVGWCGFKQTSIKYIPNKRYAGKSKYSFNKMMQLALQGITSFSIKPLRLSLILGVIFAFLGGIYGAYIAIQYFAGNNLIAGWSSVIITVLIMGGIQLCILGIVGEYLGRLFLQAKQRPNYIVKEDDIRP